MSDKLEKLDLNNDEPERVKPKKSKRRADQRDDVIVRDPTNDEAIKTKEDKESDLGDLAKAVKDLSDKWSSHKGDEEPTKLIEKKS